MHREGASKPVRLSSTGSTGARLVSICKIAPNVCLGDCTSAGGPGCTGVGAALCCSGDLCVLWDGGECPGLVGWCNNVTWSTDPDTGIRVAECHDQP
jgi:hypothetical protein